MFSCKAAFTMRFLSQHAHADGPRPHQIRKISFFKHTTLLVAPYRTDHTFGGGLSLTNVEPQHKARFLP